MSCIDEAPSLAVHCVGDIEFRAADTIRRQIVDVFIVSQGDGVSEFILVEGEVVLLKGEHSTSWKHHAHVPG